MCCFRCRSDFISLQGFEWMDHLAYRPQRTWGHPKDTPNAFYMLFFLATTGLLCLFLHGNLRNSYDPAFWSVHSHAHPAGSFTNYLDLQDSNFMLHFSFANIISYCYLWKYYNTVAQHTNPDRVATFQMLLHLSLEILVFHFVTQNLAREATVEIYGPGLVKANSTST